MAPPLAPKRMLPQNLPDVESRVSKPITTTCRSSHTIEAKAYLPIANSDTPTRSNVIENVFSKVHDSANKEDRDMGKEDNVRRKVSADEFPHLLEAVGIGIDKNPCIPRSLVNNDKRKSTAPLMVATKGLLNLTNDYLPRMEAQHLGAGADFLAMLADRASRSMCIQLVYMNTSYSTKTGLLGCQDNLAAGITKL